MEATNATVEPVTIPQRLDIDAHAAGFSKAMAHLDHATTKELDRVGFDPRLRELVRIRASQLNGCAYCVDMHTKDARVAGETGERLTALPVWREAPFFTRRERAVLAFTESVTRLSETRVPESDFELVAAELTADELGALVALLVTINAWNAIGVSTRAWEAGSYQP
ncbi:carboxymuconolactone decarboxylase family protein [Nocardioides sp.]|uniref:carboxymuconolactone decarboxylase family protein n=1 Tax=Nocardioides sp. TaxID=35761 RepID=UPI002ED59159